MSNTPMIKRIANFAYEKFTKNPGEFLLISGMISWAASCVNQTVAILINDKIPKKQKYFLIPQEITDGIVNVILFAVFTRSFTRIGERLVETGRMLTPKLKNTLLNEFKVGDKLGKTNFNIKNTDQMNELCPNKYNEKFSNEFKQFHTGVGFMFSAIGSVISCDFVTPFVRNKIASSRQKQALEKDKQQQESFQPYTPILPAQNRFGTDDYKKQASLNSPIIKTGGSMRV
jgi:hypothetical protein